MDICLSVAPSLAESDREGLTRAMQAHGHRVRVELDAAMPATGTARRYSLVDGRYELVLVAATQPGGSELSVHLRAPGSQLEHWREQGLICRATTGWETHAREHIEEGPGYLRFLHLLDEFALVHLGSARFLAEHRWAGSLRTRAEPFGGLVFSPRTSLLLELDPPRFAAVELALAEARVSALAERLGDPELRELAGGLARIGAIVPQRSPS